MMLLAFDPGGHTGYCLMDVNTNTHEVDITDYGYFYRSDYIAELVGEADIVVSEHITAPGRKAFNMVGIEVMGVIKDCCQRSDKVLVWQQPSCMQAPLKWGIVDSKDFTSEHAKDAVCHAAYYLVCALGFRPVERVRLTYDPAAYVTKDLSRY